MAQYSLTTYSFGSMQNMLLDVLLDDEAHDLSGTVGRIDYGTNPMRDTYTQFFGYGMDRTTMTGLVTDVDLYWPNQGSVGLIVDELPEIALTDLFAVADANSPRAALDALLSQVDWTARGAGYGDDFEGLYSAETIFGEGGDDYYTATMAPGMARDITDHFDGGDGQDSVNLLDLTTGVTASLKTGIVSFDEAVGGVTYARSIAMVSVEDLVGTDFRDKLIGSNAGDTLSGGKGNDVLKGGKGADLLAGNAGADRLFGGGGWDRLSGSGGRDKLVGGGGNDTLDGHGGKDRISGGAGRDDIDGGSGADRIDGGKGNDALAGGGGKDVFVFSAGGGWQGRDVIEDFNPGQDSIVFSSGQETAEISHRGGDTVIDYDGGVIRLADVLWQEEGLFAF